MYSEWASLSATIAANSAEAQSSSVLNKFPASAGKEVAVSVVKQLASNLGITQNAEPSHLVKDEEVVWCMDVICFGLSLPLQEHETIKDCVNIYCEWLTAMHPNPRISVPKPICDDPNMYCRKIISHFHNLFVPRQGEILPFLYQPLGADKINRQAVLCHRVLRTLQQTAQISQIMDRETWEALLLFLLAINEILLAPPTVKDDVGDQLCERVLSVLFEVWLLACVRCFPSPSLWKTLQESCALWRHRIALIEQWNRVNLALTSRLIKFMLGPTFPELKISDEDAQLIPSGITNECVAQTWYRFLRTIGNPTALCYPHIISKTSHFMQWALTRDKGAEPYQHPCLLLLPQIFLKAIKGISSQVDAYLGIYQPSHSHDENITNLMDIRSSLSDAIHGSGGSGLNHNTHHLFGFSSGGAGGSSSSKSGAGIASENSGGSSFLSGLSGNTATHALNAIIGHHHHHHSSSASNNSSASSSYGTPLTSTTSGLGSSSVGTGEHLPHSPTPPLQRRLAKSFSVAPSISQQKGLSKAALIGLTTSRSQSTQPPLTPTSGPPSSSSLNSLPSMGSEPRAQLAPNRPTCNSILHLFGEWLFEAAYIGGDSWLVNAKRQASEANKRPSSMVMENRKGSISLSHPNSSSDPANLPRSLTIDKFESGRAEAIGALCKIFCSKKTGEEILPVYLARFYMGLQQCMKIAELKECDETLASILLNSSDLFRLDLDGIHVLLPIFITALEVVLPEKDLKIKSQAMNYNKIELRRASINILLSMLTLPLHFQTLQIRDLNNGPAERSITFIQLKPRLINVLMNALQVETDAQNTHMLLGGLLLTVQDSVNFEEIEMRSDNMPSASPQPGPDTNIFSSACSERSASIASGGNVSLGAHSTTTIGGGATGGGSAATFTGGKGSVGRDSSSQHDYPSLTVSDDFPVELLQEFETASVYDNAHALFVRATYLVCHRLISSWKTDLNVSLAALELLSGLARLQIRDSARKLTNDALECKRAVKWICDYICYQCSRPPPAHSKDLHSTIVAAFQCTSAWLMQHPYLLQDQDCFKTVIEVVELGISGSKSVGKPGEPPKYKDQKELKPVSMRVRDAADILLTIIMEQVGYFPKEFRASETLSSLLDEVSLVKFCNSVDAKTLTREQAVQKFKYFVTENSTILGLLEEPLGNAEDQMPSLTLLLRSPFGRHAWYFEIRYLPRSKSGKKHAPVNPGRPVPMSDPPKVELPPQKHYPDGVEKAVPCAADYSIPTIEQMREQYGTDLMNRWDKLIENQAVLEKLAAEETLRSGETLGPAQECFPPTPVELKGTARLFLSQFGFINYEMDNKFEEIPGYRDLIALDSSRKNFIQDLNYLDKLSVRSHDTVHVFYMKSGQKTADEIIGNMNAENIKTLNHNFGRMLLTLGCPVEVEEHCGWTGSMATSWILRNTDPDAPREKIEDFRFNGKSCVLYWADVSSEIAFVVPSKWNRQKKPQTTEMAGAAAGTSTDGGCLSHSASDKSVWNEKNVSADAATSRPSSSTSTAVGQKPRTLSLELDQTKEPVPPTRRKNITKPLLIPQPPAKIFVVWIESFEDYLNFPIEDLLCYTCTGEESQVSQTPKASDCHVIFLHALQTGLLRVKLQGPSGRMSFATPLVDGMVLSRRVVGNLVRQTAHNMGKRRRLDHDGFQPPHVRRRIKVEDIVQKYKFNFSRHELVAHLFEGAT
ncbi:ral GTPase-activating protein subunit beta isoform X4 [Eupeodes corollae]|uniref:ral GTPase-activating protein subunit beta isoform X4 n=1 Tax=Eupeodes corollae TaxID=290404 RepID=UPI00248FCEBC|nr:ral GTPase-activating protein subunit beta isoform X4 [Eupeodes corollae]